MALAAHMPESVCGPWVTECVGEWQYSNWPNEYPSNTTKEQSLDVVTFTGAENLIVSLSNDTEMEWGYDPLYIYDGEDNLILDTKSVSFGERENIPPQGSHTLSGICAARAIMLRCS